MGADNGDGLLAAETVDGVETVFTWDLALAIPQVLATSDGSKNLYGLERRSRLAAGGVGRAPKGRSRLAAGGVGRAPKGFTGEWQDPAGMVYLRARWYNATLGRFSQVDPVAGILREPATQHPYVYGLDNAMRYVGPSGRTIRSALALVSKYRNEIRMVAEEYGIDPLLLAGVVFAENRNDYNWLQGQDWTSALTGGLFGGPEVKNLVAPILKKNPSLGITEVSLAVAAMMDDPSLVPDDYGTMSRKSRAALHEKVAAGLSKCDRESIIRSLSDPTASLDYAARYLRFLSTYRDYGENHALWLSDYNRGLSEEDKPTEYGLRIEVFGAQIQTALTSEVLPRSPLSTDEFWSWYWMASGAINEKN